MAGVLRSFPKEKPDCSLLETALTEAALFVSGFDKVSLLVFYINTSIVHHKKGL